MSIPNRQIGWSTESNLLWQVAKQIQKLSGIIANSGGGGATPNLNEVVIAGGTAISTDEFSSVNFDLDSSLATFYWLMRKDATDKQTTMYSNPNTIYLLSQTPTKDTYLEMLDGEFSIRERVLAVDDSTTVNFEEPTNTTIIKFPAKAVDGTYTLATTSDLQTVNTASDYLNDAAAQAGGIPVGGLYHTAGVVKLRLV